MGLFFTISLYLMLHPLKQWNDILGRSQWTYLEGKLTERTRMTADLMNQNTLSKQKWWMQIIQLADLAGEECPSFSAWILMGVYGILKSLFEIMMLHLFMIIKSISSWQNSDIGFSIRWFNLFIQQVYWIIKTEFTKIMMQFIRFMLGY